MIENQEFQNSLEVLNKTTKKRVNELKTSRNNLNETICFSCAKNTKKIPNKAEYFNLDGFNSLRYICNQCCSFYSYKNVIPLNLNKAFQDPSLLIAKNFIKNCTMNKDYHKMFMSDQNNNQNIPLDELIEKLFKDQIKTKLQEFTKEMQGFWSKIKNMLKIRFNALIGTFERQTVSVFLQNMKNDHISEQNKLIMLQSLKYANYFLFQNPQVLKKSIYDSFGGISSVIDEQLRQFKFKEKVIIKKIQKYDIGKIYKQQQKQYERKKRMQNFGYTNPEIALSQIIPIIDLQESFLDDNQVIMSQINERSFIEEQTFVNHHHHQQNSSNKNKKSQIINQSTQHKITIDFENYTKVWKQSNQPPMNLKSIKIKFDRQTQTTIKNILLRQQIQQIYIQDPRFCKKQFIICFINNLPKLRVLQLNCRNQFDEQCMMIAIDKMKHIQKLHYGYNVLNSIGEICQNSSFRKYERQKLKPRPLITNKVILNIIDTHPEIKNIYIRQLVERQKNVNQPMYNEQHQQILYNTPDNIFKRLQDLQSLESIALGAENMITLTDYIEYQLSEQDWGYFAQLKGLKSICMLNVIINHDKFMKVLQQNSPTLVSLYLHNCQGFTDSHTIALAKCQNLRQLYLHQCGQTSKFTATHIFDLRKLRTLALRKCDSLSLMLMEKKLTNLRDVTHLDFYGCQYVTDNCFLKLGDLAYVQYLNLQGTTVSTRIPIYIQDLKRLRSLCIGNTRIIVKQLQQICQGCTNIQKLSVRFLNKANMISRGIVNPQILWRSSQRLKCLKHLDVVDCQKMTDQLFRELKISNLQFVNYGLNNFTKEKIRQLQKKGIVFVQETFK